MIDYIPAPPSSAMQSDTASVGGIGSRIVLPSLAARTTGDTPLEIYGIELDPGMTVTISAGTLQCHVETTHEHATAWSLAAIATRSSSGTSVLISNASGGITSLGTNFPAPANTRPKAVFADPSANSHRFSLNVIGRVGVNICWQGSLEITIGRAP